MAHVDAFIPAFLLVVGEAPEIASPPPPGVVVYRTEPDSLDATPRPLAGLLLDARSHTVEQLATARANEWLADVPVMVMIGAGADPDLVAEVLGADDVLRAGCTEGELRRRLGLLLGLGRARLGMSFAEQALEHSRSSLSIADVASPDHPLVHVSPVFETLTGFPVAEVLGRSCRFLQGPDADPVAIDTMRAAVAERQRASVVLRNQRRDGTSFWNEVTIFPVVAQGVTLRWMGGLQHDATRLVEAQDEAEALSRLLADRQRFVHAVLDGIEVGIVIADGAGHVTFVNGTAAAAIGAPALHVGRDVKRVLELPAEPAQLLGEAPRVVLEHTAIGHDGGELDLELSISRADGAAHEGDGYFFIFRDLRLDKQREQERRRLERLAAMGTMVAGFAHEVRNPVAALRSLAESLAEDLDDVRLRMPQVARMMDVLGRVERLVCTSLQFGRPDPPRLAPHRPWVLISEALTAVGPRTRELRDTIRVDVAPDLPDVVVDQAQLVQVLVILLDNALDATASPRRVQVRASSGERDPSSGREEVVFEVLDDGPGIPSEILGRVFDPFFTTKPSGTGLGLSIAQQLVSENRGRLDVASPRGGPTSFTLVFPAQRTAPECLTPRPSPPDRTPPT